MSTTSSPLLSAGSSSSSLQRPRLEGKVAVVTGGAAGIGESIVRIFHKHGAKICVIDLQDDRGRSLCESLGGEGSAYYFHGDVSIEQDVRNAVDFTVKKFGTIDIMVNNAGIAGPPMQDIRDYDAAIFKKVFDVNVNGAFHGMKHAATVMIPCGKGSIVSIASVASVVGGFAPHGYAGSKSAVVGLTKNVAAELGKHGIRVNCVSPFATPTDMAFGHLPQEERTGDVYESFLNFVESGANLKGVSLLPNDIAEAVLFFASDESKYVSGHNLVIDGGVTSVNHSMRIFN